MHRQPFLVLRETTARHMYLDVGINAAFVRMQVMPERMNALVHEGGDANDIEELKACESVAAWGGESDGV